MGIDEGPFQNITSITFPTEDEPIPGSVLYQWNFSVDQWNAYTINEATGEPTRDSNLDVFAQTDTYQSYSSGGWRNSDTTNFPFNSAGYFTALTEPLGNRTIVCCNSSGFQVWTEDVSGPSDYPLELGPAIQQNSVVWIGTKAGQSGKWVHSKPLSGGSVSSSQLDTSLVQGLFATASLCPDRQYGSSYLFFTFFDTDFDVRIGRTTPSGGLTATGKNPGGSPVFGNLLIPSTDGYVYDWTAATPFRQRAMNTQSMTIDASKQFNVNLTATVCDRNTVVADWLYRGGQAYNRSGTVVWPNVGPSGTIAHARINTAA